MYSAKLNFYMKKFIMYSADLFFIFVILLYREIFKLRVKVKKIILVALIM